MARTVNEQEFAEKRAEILDVTWRLMYRKGYEQITIRDIIDELKISKGAFYHYFGSKQEVLEALLARMQEQGDRIFAQVMAEPGLSPLARLQRFFDSAGRWKVAQKENILALLRAWHSDENAVVRLHVTESMVRQMTPLLGGLIAESVAAGELDTAYPDQAGAIALNLLIGMGDTFTKMLLEPEPLDDPLGAAVRMTAAYNEALERVLGAQPGALHLIEPATIREWFVAGGIL